MSAKPLPILTGDGLVLRPPRPNDATAWLALGNDPDIARLYGASRAEIVPPTPESAARTIDGFVRHGHVWLIDAGGVIGHIRLDRIDTRDRRAALAIGISDPARLGRGLGTEAIRLVLTYAFARLGLHRIGVRVIGYNTRAIRAYEKCGFVVEGREREAALVDGEWHDDILMGVLDREVAARA